MKLDQPRQAHRERSNHRRRSGFSLFVPMMAFTVRWNNGHDSANASPSLVYLGRGVIAHPTIVAPIGTTNTMQTTRTPYALTLGCGIAV